MADPKKTSLLRSTVTVSLITLLSRIAGMVREMVGAWALGTSFYADAFALAFSLPNLFRRLTAEGAMSNAFIPVFCEVDKREGRQRALDFARSFFWALTLLLVVLTALFLWQADFLVSRFFAAGFTGEPLAVTVLLTRVMFGYIILISLAAVAQGVLNSLGVFWISAITPVWLNLAIISVALGLAGFFENPALPFALGVMVGGLAQLLFQMPILYKKGLRLFQSPWYDPKIKEVFSLIVPTIFGVGIYQINILISNLIATTLGEGSLSALTFSNRLLELVLGVMVVSITTVILPKLSGHFIDKELTLVARHLTRTLKIVAFVTLPVTALTLALSDELVATLFLRGRFDLESLKMTSGALQLHILGLVFIAFNRVLLTAYQGARRIKITVAVSAVVVAVNLLAAYGLSGSLGHRGIALASSLSQMVQLLLLWALVGRLGIGWLWEKRLVLSLAKSLLASLLLFGFLFWARPFLLPWGAPWAFFLASLGGVLVYLGVCTLLVHEELQETLALLLKRKRS